LIEKLSTKFLYLNTQFSTVLTLRKVVGFVSTTFQQFLFKNFFKKNGLF